MNVQSGEHAYPRPQLCRSEWSSLNGAWDFAFDPEGTWNAPGQVRWDRQITVPFAPETAASGVGDTSFNRAVWYRRLIDRSGLREGERLILHFGAVDYMTTVWINGVVATRHEGGYTPFRTDITPLLTPDGPQEIVVRAEDDPHDLAKPRGKQDWKLQPHSIWYPRTSGIWQTVWTERVPASAIGTLRWHANLEHWEIGVGVTLDGTLREDLRLRVTLHRGEQVLADDTYRVIAGEVHRRIALSDPGIDDYRNELLWSPGRPTLIDARLQLLDPAGIVLDEVTSYTAIRSVTVQGDRFVLNGRPLALRMVLDQGLWPETGLTSPDDDALRRDVELAKAMGFNGVRKHQKIEDPRYLYWADQLGLLVWEEMPSAYRFTRRSIERTTRQWGAAIERDASHPCIIAWVPLNESWGVPDLPSIDEQRHYVSALYHLTKTIDAERPVIGNDGWETVATDIVGIHDYDEDPGRIASRYAMGEGVTRLLQQERPGGRMLTVQGYAYSGQPIMLTEFGGISFTKEQGDGWGYSRARSEEDFAARYGWLLAVVNRLSVFAGFCYTQFADTYQEANGLLYADRSPKFPLPQIEAATRGNTVGEHLPVDAVARGLRPVADRAAARRARPAGPLGGTTCRTPR